VQVVTGSISTYVFTMRRGRPEFLLLLRAPHLNLAGTWQAVHGMIEPDEKAYDAAWREAVEETGLTPERFFRSDFVESFYSDATDGVHLIPAFAAFVEGAPEPVLSEEHTAWEWCHLEEGARRLVWPSQKHALRIIAEATAGWPDVGVGLTDVTALFIR
jgi:dATP pyrophosphohydrolase